MATIKIEVGNENFGHGLTKVVLESDGTVHIENVRKLVLNKKLPQKILTTTVAKVFELVQAPDVFKLRKARTMGLPDEARYKVDVAGEKLEVWDSDVRTNTRLDELLSLLKELVKQSSNEEIIL